MDQNAQIRIVIADDNQAIRTMFRDLLAHYPEFEIVGEAENGIDAIKSVRQQNPDVLLLDIHMPVFDGMETLEILRKTDDQICIILLSAFENQFFLSEAIAKGANGYLMKDDATELLVEAMIECVRSERLILSPQISVKNYADLYSSYV
jgi:DNA-binding NarL/FixJ family response regulator